MVKDEFIFFISQTNYCCIWNTYNTGFPRYSQGLRTKKTPRILKPQGTTVWAFSYRLPQKVINPQITEIYARITICVLDSQAADSQNCE